MGKIISTIIGLVLLVLVGFWIFNNNDADLAGNNDANETNVTENQDFTGIGGPEEGFDPLEGLDDDGMNSDGVDNYGDEGAIYPEKG